MLRELFLECLHTEYRQSAHGGSYAYRRDGDRLFLFFQHSHGATDWGNNLDFGAVPYRDMQPTWHCHAGFLRVWKPIRRALAPVLADPTVRAVTIVGYSHGAALSLLCHEYCFYHRPDLRDSLLGFGFGCPRVLYGCVPDPLSLRWERFFLIRNQDDLVTHLPPRILGFCHVGNLVLIGKKGRYNAIDAHRPESYLAELEGL